MPTATPPPPADLQRLALLIEAEAIQLQEFMSLLEHERTCLLARRTDDLVSLAQEKSERYQRMQRLHDDRSRLLAKLGRDMSDASIRALCAGLPRVLKRWDEVLESARRAQEANRLNGKLILERMAHNQAALSVLLSAANHPQLYDAAGQARPSGGGRILGSA